MVEETLKWIHATQSLVLLRNIVASGLEGDESAILQVLGELEALRLKGVFCLIEEELSLLERYATECRGELQIRDGVQALVSLVEEALGECYSQSSNASSRDENRAVAYNELRIASAVPLLRKGITLPQMVLLSHFGDKALRPRVFSVAADEGGVSFDDATTGYYAFLEYVAQRAYELLVGAVTVDRVKLKELLRELEDLSSYTLLHDTYICSTGAIIATTLSGSELFGPSNSSSMESLQKEVLRLVLWSLYSVLHELWYSCVVRNCLRCKCE